MRHCPACNQQPTRVETASGESVYVCSHCGWGRERAASLGRDSDESSDAGVSVFKVALGWVFSAALIVGPYVAMLIFVPQVQPWMHPTYWLVMATYLMAACVLNPSPDMSNLGWGGGMIDNPFSWEDDANRHALGWALFLLPGKVVAWTVAATFRLLTGK